jgi:hypothetical protein
VSTPVFTGVGSPALGIALPWARRHVGATMRGIKLNAIILACAGITLEGLFIAPERYFGILTCRIGPFVQRRE